MITLTLTATQYRSITAALPQGALREAIERQAQSQVSDAMDLINSWNNGTLPGLETELGNAMASFHANVSPPTPE